MDDEATSRKGHGLDFSIIILPDFEWASLLANGVRPITELRWGIDPDTSYHVYKLVGFPATADPSHQGMSQLTCYTIRKATDADVEINETGHPAWFVGTMPGTVTSVLGMSGGPVFGFRKADKPGFWHYDLVAVQSWQARSDRMIYATPLLSFAPTMKRLLWESRVQAASYR